MLNQVRFVPDLKRNLISLGYFDSKGYIFNSYKGRLSVLKGTNEVLRGNKRNDLYYLVGETMTACSNTSLGGDHASLWHRRLGHVGEKV